MILCDPDGVSLEMPFLRGWLGPTILVLAMCHSDVYPVMEQALCSSRTSEVLDWHHARGSDSFESSSLSSDYPLPLLLQCYYLAGVRLP